MTDKLKNRPANAIEILLKGKADSELLASIVRALSDDNGTLLDRLSVPHGNGEQAANAKVVKSICKLIMVRTPDSYEDIVQNYPEQEQADD